VFTNFGKKTVDLFAPGVDILSTIPDNGYGLKSGTSMATPAAAGVAALILAHDSSMDAESLRSLILDTGRRYPKLQVKVPGTENLTLFSNLSTMGSIADVVEAVKALNK
jgi:cell wall-associated protease